MKPLFLFPSTRAVIHAENLLRAGGIPLRVIPVPKDLTADCGMAIEVDTVTVGGPDATEAAVALLVEQGVPHELHRPKPAFDLLTTVEQGGCSAKLPPDLLFRITAGLRVGRDPNLLVGFNTGDDAAVYRLSDDLALIETVDFFPPVCSDPYEFGRIAAANALSDVYAMGGRVLTALNVVLFPAAGIPFEVLAEILRGGADAVAEAGGLLVGGHTIAGTPPTYGLAVTGLVHPDRVTSNATARPGDVLILTKPLGTGIVIAGACVGEAATADLRAALDSMKRLNRAGAGAMAAGAVRCATDITGFGLLGHALNIARASDVSLEFTAATLPLLPGARDLAARGCLPGGAFRNLAHVEPHTAFDPALPYELKMLAVDPQTSGGLLFSLAEERVEAALAELAVRDQRHVAVVGRVLPRGAKYLILK